MLASAASASNQGRSLELEVKLEAEDQPVSPQQWETRRQCRDDGGFSEEKYHRADSGGREKIADADSNSSSSSSMDTDTSLMVVDFGGMSKCHTHPSTTRSAGAFLRPAGIPRMKFSRPAAKLSKSGTKKCGKSKAVNKKKSTVCCKPRVKSEMATACLKSGNLTEGSKKASEDKHFQSPKALDAEHTHNRKKNKAKSGIVGVPRKAPKCGRKEKSYTGDGQTSRFKSCVCESCGKMFLSKVKLKKHSIVHSQERPHKCDLCPKAFLRWSDLNIHKKIHSGVKEHECFQCGKSFYRAGDLKAHMTVHAGARPHVCDVCGRTFKEPKTLRNHKLIHDGFKPFACEICGKSFVLAGALKVHKVIHAERKPYVCDICHKGFSQLGNLRQHKLQHSTERSHICHVCGDGFADPSTLKRHMAKHQDSPYVCKVCGKVLADARSLKNHALLHVPESKLFECSMCRKAYTRADTLARHMVIHSGEKKHICEVCSKAFTEAGTLKAHMLIHVGLRPYCCEFCGKGFFHTGDLKRHRLVHTGEKPHVCDICNKAFTRVKTLKVHRLKHGQGPLPDDYTRRYRQVAASSASLSGLAPSSPSSASSTALTSLVFSQPQHRCPDTEQVLHKCPSCGESFALAVQLKMHHHLVHQGVNFEQSENLDGWEGSVDRSLAVREKSVASFLDCKSRVGEEKERDCSAFEDHDRSRPSCDPDKESTPYLDVLRRRNIKKVHYDVDDYNDDHDGDEAASDVDDDDREYFVREKDISGQKMSTLILEQSSGKCIANQSLDQANFTQSSYYRCRAEDAYEEQVTRNNLSAQQTVTLPALLAPVTPGTYPMGEQRLDVYCRIDSLERRFQDSLKRRYQYESVNHGTEDFILAEEASENQTLVGSGLHLQSSSNHRLHLTEAPAGTNKDSATLEEDETKKKEDEEEEERKRKEEETVRQYAAPTFRSVDSFDLKLIGSHERTARRKDSENEINDSSSNSSDVKGDDSMDNSDDRFSSTRCKLTRSFMCEVCGKTFPRACDVRKHSLVHSEERPHKCDQCDRAFVRWSDLKTHKRIHTGTRTHSCTRCPKAYFRASDLKNHMLTHLGIRPHCCDQCGKLFTEAKTLRTHKLTHTGIKPHQCFECGKAFLHAGALKHHMETHARKQQQKESCASVVGTGIFVLQ